jgi:hypothetical protein
MRRKTSSCDPGKHTVGAVLAASQSLTWIIAGPAGQNLEVDRTLCSLHLAKTTLQGGSNARAFWRSSRPANHPSSSPKRMWGFDRTLARNLWEKGAFNYTNAPTPRHLHRCQDDPFDGMPHTHTKSTFVNWFKLHSAAGWFVPLGGGGSCRIKEDWRGYQPASAPM